MPFSAYFYKWSVSPVTSSAKRSVKTKMVKLINYVSHRLHVLIKHMELFPFIGIFYWLLWRHLSSFVNREKWRRSTIQSSLEQVPALQIRNFSDPKSIAKRGKNRKKTKRNKSDNENPIRFEKFASNPFDLQLKSYIINRFKFVALQKRCEALDIITYGWRCISEILVHIVSHGHRWKAAIGAKQTGQAA